MLIYCLYEFSKYIYKDREVLVDRVELVKVEATKRRVYEDDKVPGGAGEVVDIVSVGTVRDAGEPVDDGNEHQSEGDEVARTVKEGGPQHSNMTHKEKAIEQHEKTNE